jgi:hypothetical protein
VFIDEKIVNVGYDDRHGWTDVKEEEEEKVKILNEIKVREYQQKITSIIVHNYKKEKYASSTSNHITSTTRQNNLKPDETNNILQKR